MSVLVGKKAPAFDAKAVINGGEIIENFSLSQYEGEKYVVFFFSVVETDSATVIAIGALTKASVQISIQANILTLFQFDVDDSGIS